MESWFEARSGLTEIGKRCSADSPPSPAESARGNTWTNGGTHAVSISY